MERTEGEERSTSRKRTANNCCCYAVDYSLRVVSAEFNATTITTGQNSRACVKRLQSHSLPSLSSSSPSSSSLLTNCYLFLLRRATYKNPSGFVSAAATSPIFASSIPGTASVEIPCSTASQVSTQADVPFSSPADEATAAATASLKLVTPRAERVSTAMV